MDNFDLESLNGMSAPEMTSMLKDIGDGNMGQGIANLYVFEIEPEQACDIKSLVIGAVIGALVSAGVAAGIICLKKKNSRKAAVYVMEPEKPLVKADSDKAEESEE